MSDPNAKVKFEVLYGVSSPWAFLGAPKLEAIARRFGLTLHLRPILVIQANGGIPLRTRHQARQEYHALDLRRTAARLSVPLNDKPTFYPVRDIKVPATAIIRLQTALGTGHPLVVRFSYLVQQALWVGQKDIADVEVLRTLAREAGVDEDVVLKAIVDNTADDEDAAGKEFLGNLAYAESLGIFGTPTYVVNGEIYWGQDRLDYVEDAIAALLEQKA